MKKENKREKMGNFILCYNGDHIPNKLIQKCLINWILKNSKSEYKNILIVLIYYFFINNEKKLLLFLFNNIFF